VFLLLWFPSSLIVKNDGQLLRAFPRVAVAAHVYLSHRQLTEVGLFLPSFPLVITPAFQRMLRCVCARTASGYAGIQCVAGTQANKCFLAPELSLRFWYQSEQRALIATVGLLRSELYLLKWFCWHDKKFISLFVGISNSWVICPSVFGCRSSERLPLGYGKTRISKLTLSIKGRDWGFRSRKAFE
jgi:hypothetical protein